MNPLRTIERTAVDGSLRVARLPLDTAIRLLPGNGEGPSARAKVTVDQVDATVRGAVGALLRDEMIVEDAQRRSAAVQERREALELKARAERKGAQADARLDQREEQAGKQREQAAKREQSRRKHAAEEHDERVKRAAKTANQRLKASREASARTEQAIEKREPRARLVALEEKQKALDTKQTALTAADEARRLADAAAKAKAERKQD